MYNVSGSRSGVFCVVKMCKLDVNEGSVIGCVLIVNWMNVVQVMFVNGFFFF
jgi:hypothetical protein